MIGIKYLRYHPKLIFQLPSGLAIYQSMFQNADGGRGVIGGPHRIFTEIHNQFFNSSEKRNFFTEQYNLYRMGFQINPDISILAFKDDSSKFNNKIYDRDGLSGYLTSHVSKSQRTFDDVEMTGSEIQYRCTNCRSCKLCKSNGEIELMSVKEEVEQSIINASVHVDIKNQVTTASLPFIHNPLIKLEPNRNRAFKVYQQQVKRLDNQTNRKDKIDVIESEDKLQKLGHVEYVKNLPIEIQTMLKEDPIQNFIPWRAVWKNSSVSTPCRIVFDASQVTSSGFSLNDLLAKGRNNMNKLQEILIKWTIHKVALHTDVKKMYNTVKLREQDWCFQRYIWEKDLDSTKIPEEKVVKTLIY